MSKSTYRLLIPLTHTYKDSTCLVFLMPLTSDEIEQHITGAESPRVTPGSAQGLNYRLKGHWGETLLYMGYPLSYCADTAYAHWCVGDRLFG